MLNVAVSVQLKAFLTRASDTDIEDTTWLESIATLLAGEPPWFRKDGGCTDHQQPFELYNLRDDLAQKNNLSAEQTERAQAMMASLERFRSEGRSVPRREMNKK